MAINNENTKEFRVKLGKRIRDARIKAGLTQYQLGELLGKSDNVITNWEKGTNRPDADMINQLCNILKVSPNWLLDYNPKAGISNSNHEDIFTLAAHKVGHEGPLTEEEKAQIELAIKIALAKHKK